MMGASTAAQRPDLHSARAARYRRYRHLKDGLTACLMAMGGISVIITIVLIAFYLLYVVLPMFKAPRLEQLAAYRLNLAGEALYYAMEEQHEIGLRITADGQAGFFRTADGSLLAQQSLTGGMRPTAFAAGDPASRLLALGLDDGAALLVQHDYVVSYPDDVRLITPQIRWPLGDAPITLDAAARPIAFISAQGDEEQTTIAAITADHRLILTHIKPAESLFGEADEPTIIRTEMPVTDKASQLLMDVGQRELYIAERGGFISYYDISDKSAIRLVQRVRTTQTPVEISRLAFLSGGISILVGDSAGNITQWFPVRDAENNYTLERIRRFQPPRDTNGADAPGTAIAAIAPEYFRKGFLALDGAGYLAIYHATAHRTVARQQLNPQARHIAIAPRANAMLVEDDEGRMQFWRVDNEHPEISWRAIWGKVWYESRERAQHIWQSSSASSDFEPKFSLTPLAFGTVKAAFYAMLFAMPLAILGAMYTAYFMSAGMRALVKPTIEIMEALPTVILGFLAGLWFAPFAEQHLPGLFLCIILLPPAVILAAWGYSRLPPALRHTLPDGWEAALLIPVIILTGLVALSLSQPLEVALFAGNMPLWLTRELGITYDQRNSLVVGIAMGFAVIPTIFSISEDALYSVPRHLTTGSLALGATPWQTMMRVVLLTASPGIFSAVMIGAGRAVGETMIVLMATGNTAIMDMNIFEGFRALSANIAVEMPESEVGSTHYRILFLAGLVLFAATFLFNTLAELVRQRLRVKYSSL